MKQGLGSVFMFNIIIVFIILVFAFLAATLSYSKAFRMNSRITNAIEKYEGFNSLAKKEIEKNLNTIGYRKGGKKDCPSKGGTLMTNGSESHKYCVYQFKLDKYHYSYGVLTYMDMNIPIINQSLEIPIYSKTNKIYRFGVK